VSEERLAEAAPSRLDGIVVRRWLIALAFASTVEDLAIRLSPVSAGVALVSADTASEAILGILADHSGIVPGVKDPHEQMLQRAMATATSAGMPMSAPQARAVRLMHGRRNSVIHQGDDASVHDVDEARIVVRNLLETLSAVLPALTLLPSDAGPLRAVASQLPALDELADRMVDADSRLIAGDLPGARASGAIALAMTLRRVHPPLSYGGPRWRGGRPAGVPAPVVLGLEAAAGRLRVLEQWVVPMALGLSAADYDRLSTVFGGAVLYGTGWQAEPLEADEVLPTELELRWAQAELARLVFRLWETRSLRFDPSDVEL
jgi:hypothetical protein